MWCSISNYLGGFSGYFSVTTQLIPLSGSIYYMISVLLRLLRCILWPQTWSLMASISCELEKNVFSALVGWGSLQALTTSSCLMKFWVQTRPCRLPACWIFLFLAEERRVSSCHHNPSLSPWRSVISCHSCLAVLLRGAYKLRTVMSYWRTDPVSLCSDLFLALITFLALS